MNVQMRKLLFSMFYSVCPNYKESRVFVEGDGNKRGVDVASFKLKINVPIHV